jgi:cytochrome c peroxidase
VNDLRREPARSLLIGAALLFVLYKEGVWIMRTIKLLVVFLFSLPLLAFGNKFFPSFFATGQTGSLPAPTEVIASDNAYSNKVGINWTTARGATAYRVFRHTSNDSASAISLGTTAAGAFFDTTAVVGQNYFYWVRSENGSVVSSLSVPDQGMRAGGVIAGPVQPLAPPPEPAGNPVTATKAYLGKTLFWDEQLSSTRTVSCGTCHFATNGGSDSRTIINNTRARNQGADLLFNTADDVFGSPGVPSNNVDGTYNWDSLYGFREQVTGRKSRSYIDAAYSNTLFWDGRATSTFSDPVTGAVLLPNGAALESQVLGPPVNAAEMAHSFRDWTDVAARVSASKPLALSPAIPAALEQWIGGRSYPELFQEAFGTAEVTPARIAMAMATFERTLYSDRTPFDQSISQINPLTAAEARGQNVFNNQGRCNTCHTGTLFTDNQFHNIGLRPQTEDPGRFAVTGNPNNLGEFRTPGLRNVGLRAPYMHNGGLATLEEVVDFYNRGGDFNAPNIDRNRIRPLNLTAQQRSDLVAFLRRPLTDPRVAAGTSPFDRPTLYTESNRVPQVIGNGVSGSSGHIPQVTAFEPPLVGNPGFTVGVSNALGGAQAVLVIDSSDPGTGPAIPATASLTRVTVQLSGSGAGQGFGSVSLRIPDNAALVGSTFFGRWFVTDANAPGGVAVTPAFRITIFGEATAANTNQIDDPQFFVRQQYLDFLGREPDTTGFQNWLNTLLNCPGGGFGEFDNPTCDRVHISSSFYLSDEFRGRGYWVYRFYQASFGRSPFYAEFIPDMLKVGGAQSPEAEAASKTAFTNEWLNRAEFKNKYDPLDNAAYVDELLRRAGVTLTNRDALVSSLQSGQKTRADVLREIVESKTVEDRFFVEGFVSMQYFGYLRRDPDPTGYTNWVNTLRADPINYRHMIFGFIYSPEYRGRFGP